MWTATEISYVGGGQATLPSAATGGMSKWVMDAAAPDPPALPQPTNVGRSFMSARAFAGCSQLNANLYVSGGQSDGSLTSTIYDSVEKVLF